MDNPFQYLRNAEWQMLLAQSQTKEFEPDHMILEEGHKPSGIIIIRSGEVKVCRDHSGFQIELASAGPGAIFGEMSFIESEPANASVITTTKAQLLYITHEHVEAIIRENPGFFGRFYQSLAYILCKRLRETTGQVTGDTSGDVWASGNG